jgi:hypothetical protein
VTTIGNVGAPWRATVTGWGAIEPWDGAPALDWWVAADDRWHSPREEPSLRQRRLSGAPVIETALRVPGGDALQRAYCTADAGGLAVIEVENASSLPFAVAFSHGALRTARPPTEVPVAGIVLPPDAVVFPVGHRATVRVALPHDGRGAGPLPSSLPSAERVARGWVAQTEAGVRLEGFEERADDLVAARAALLLEGPNADDGTALVLGAAELVRLGQVAVPWVDPVVEATDALARHHRRTPELPWDVAAALDSAVELLQAAGETRGASDAVALASRLGPGGPLPDDAPDEAARLVAWSVRRLVVPSSDGADLVSRLPRDLLGRNVAIYDVPVPRGSVSCAVRWHGERPALLWSVTGDMVLRAPGLDPTWSTTASSGEALLGPPRS